MDSAINSAPTSTRNVNASILIVGCRSMKVLTVEETTIITRTEATMAATMISIRLASPTAVNTVSSENAMSITPICATMSQKLFIRPRLPWEVLPASMSRISNTLLTTRNAPPANSTRPRPEIDCPRIENRGARIEAIHVIENNSAMRVSMAKLKPNNRALLRCAGGRRSTRSARKMMLSMPSTISSAASVRKDSHACGSESSSTPLRQAVDFFRLRVLALHQVFGVQAKIERQRRRYVDRGICAGNDADHQRRGETVQRLAAENQQGDDHQQGHQFRHQRTGQRLIDGLVDHLGDRELARDARPLADSIEHDHRVVQGVADDGENPRNRCQVEGHLGKGEESEHADRLVQHREDGAARQLQGETQQHVDGDEHQRRHQRPAALDEQLLADLRTHHFGALQFHALVHAGEHFEYPCADLVALGVRIRRQTNQDIP